MPGIGSTRRVVTGIFGIQSRATVTAELTVVPEPKLDYELGITSRGSDP